MIGHLRDDHVYVFGSRSGCGWRRLISRQNDELGLQLDFSWNLKPIADYYPFFESGVPVLMFHTGLHENYHRPSDTADLISGEGMSRIVRLLFGVVYELAESDEKIPYRKAAGRETPETEKFITQQIALPAERLGVALDAKPAPEGGVRLVRVNPNSPADKAGLKTGRPDHPLRRPRNRRRRRSDRRGHGRRESRGISAATQRRRKTIDNIRGIGRPALAPGHSLARGRCRAGRDHSYARGSRFARRPRRIAARRPHLPGRRPRFRRRKRLSRNGENHVRSRWNCWSIATANFAP